MKIKMLVMDVDGTLTDGKIYMSGHGEIMKAFDVKDGYAIAHMLPELEIIPVIITGRESEIVERRARELKIDGLYQGVSDKFCCLERISNDVGISFDEIAYIGDDVNDLRCICAVHEAGGFTGCPADAVNEVKASSDFISNRNGGQGAVREFVEWLSS